MTTSFTVERVIPRDDNVDVHVRWPGGGEIFTFPKSFPTTTILASLRIEFRRREVEQGAAPDKYRDLLGRHDV